MPSTASRAVVVAFAAAMLLARARSANAADRVAVLRFTAAGGGTTTTQLQDARAATRDAVVLMHDELPSEAQLKSAEGAVEDGAPDTSDEYRAAGRIAGAQWTLAAQVDAHGGTWRLELEACQVATGRVESLVREVDARAAAPQIAQMLALLLRPQGIADAVPPWEASAPTASTPVRAAPSPAPPSTPPATPTSETPLAAPTPPDVALYGARHPFGVGAGIEVLGAFARAAGARGSPTAGLLTAAVDYALASVPGLELVGDLGVGALGPTSLRLDVGARYLWMVAPGRVGLGPEAAIGAFFPFGGDKDARFLLRGALPVVWMLSDAAQIELYPQLAGALGGTASLGFVGGGGRFVLRF